jgi:hypothetical protein
MAKSKRRPSRSIKQAPASPRRRRGRPTVLTPAIGLTICERLACGESLRAICADATMPGRTTVLRWLGADPQFRGQYARAREDQADLLAEQIVEIADTPVLGRTRKIKPNGKAEITEGDMIEHRRLQVDARKWFASRVAPKKYGDRVATEHSGPEGGPIQVQPVPPPMMPAELAAEVRKVVRNAEELLGLKPPPRAGLAKRVAQILASDELLPPELYAAVVKGAPHG